MLSHNPTAVSNRGTGTGGEVHVIVDTSGKCGSHVSVVSLLNFCAATMMPAGVFNLT